MSNAKRQQQRRLEREQGAIGAPVSRGRANPGGPVLGRVTIGYESPRRPRASPTAGSG